MPSQVNTKSMLPMKHEKLNTDQDSLYTSGPRDSGDSRKVIAPPQ